MALSRSTFRTTALAARMVMQPATDWTKAAADAIPVVDDMSCLYTNTSNVYVTLYREFESLGT